MKPSLSWSEQVDLLVERGLQVADRDQCAVFLATNSYYRFSGYARYFQRAPHEGDNRFRPQVGFDQIREVYLADEQLRHQLVLPLARVEVLLRSCMAHVIGECYGPCRCYLAEEFYLFSPSQESALMACGRDLERSKERHILRYKNPAAPTAGALVDRFAELPVWSAVEAWSFGTLSKCLERGAQGLLADDVATSLGVATAGFAYRIRSLVYLRNRVAHHARLWNHSVIDAGPTPNNVRVKAKRLAGQFQPRSVLDVIASLDDICTRTQIAEPLLPNLATHHPRDSVFWHGLSHPSTTTDAQ